MKPAIGFLFLLLLQGCATLEQGRYCDVIPQTRLPVLHPDQYGDVFIRNQVVTLDSRDNHFEFISQLEVHKDSLILVALTPIGQKLFQIQYTTGNIRFDKFGLPVDFDPAYLLADIGLIYARAGAVERCLGDQTLLLRIQNMTETQRVFIDDKRETITIDYHGQSATDSELIDYTNQALDYRIRIQTLAYERLEK